MRIGLGFRLSCGFSLCLGFCLCGCFCYRLRLRLSGSFSLGFGLCLCGRIGLCTGPGLRGSVRLGFGLRGGCVLGVHLSKLGDFGLSLCPGLLSKPFPRSRVVLRAWGIREVLYRFVRVTIQDEQNNNDNCQGDEDLGCSAQRWHFLRA